MLVYSTQSEHSTMHQGLSPEIRPKIHAASPWRLRMARYHLHRVASHLDTLEDQDAGFGLECCAATASGIGIKAPSALFSWVVAPE